MPDSTPFNRATGRGYDPDQVDALLDLAKRQYQNPNELILRASDLRGVRLDLVPGGYSIYQVDTALDNLEDHFMKTEVRAFRERFGDAELLRRQQEIRDSLLPRLKRARGKRFARVSILTRGYEVKKADELCEQILSHFEGSSPLRITDVRTAQFLATRRGYSMPQFDSFLDRVIEALQLEVSK